MFRGAFLTKVREAFGHTMSCSRKDHELLVGPVVSVRCYLFTVLRNTQRATALWLNGVANWASAAQMLGTTTAQ